MLIGHLATGFAAKALAPRASLGSLLLAAQFVDLLWPAFLMLGWESVRIVPGATASNPLVFDEYPISHSLVAAIGWGVLLGVAARMLRSDLRTALVLAALVPGHWLLDALVHVPDLPLTPWGEARAGLGLWNLPLAELALEVAMLAVGVLIYVRVTTPRDRVATWSLVAFVATLLALQVASASGAAPPTMLAIAWVGHAQWLLIAWGWWIDRRRSVASPRPNRGFGDLR